ncbi:MAG: cytochrome C oxidase subunit IV family protein [Burkholderiaceae bacterium]|nr:cytochrome C oxidase subunit IV family protein [Burkholderiaceae bacterium]
MLSNTINRIWLALLAATLVTFWLGESGLSGSAGVTPILVMFGLAYGKGLLVILDFMELRHAPALWRRLMVGWLTLVTLAIVLTYLVGAGVFYAKTS